MPQVGERRGPAALGGGELGADVAGEEADGERGPAVDAHPDSVWAAPAGSSRRSMHPGRLQVHDGCSPVQRLVLQLLRQDAAAHQDRRRSTTQLDLGS